MTTNFSDLPLTLRVKHVADVYGISAWQVRKYVTERNWSQVPPPDFLDPLRWKKPTVQKHWERADVVQQRLARVKTTLQIAG